MRRAKEIIGRFNSRLTGQREAVQVARSAYSFISLKQEIQLYSVQARTLLTGSQAPS